MSYAIIRNEKYKRENLKGIYRHNERKNHNYSNKNIDSTKTHLNYSLKDCTHTYEKEFDYIKDKYNLKGQIKNVSNIACEYIITSDKSFFEAIGEDKTKRYFETAYKFVCEYKQLTEKYILSAKVHMDEETPHMHLLFIPVVHTIDKKGNEIDKIACSEFWKEKDSYRRLQDAFYEYMVQNGFDLERGNTTERVHLSVEDYKNITNFENSKTVLNDIKIEVPQTPTISEFNKLTLNRDKKIQEEIIKPKDELISKLCEDNVKLHNELNKHITAIEKASKLETENSHLRKINMEYKGENYKLENENYYLKKAIKTIENTLNKFIKWICNKFSVSSEDEFIRDFEKETNTFMDIDKQIKFEELVDNEMEDEDEL